MFRKIIILVICTFLLLYSAVLYLPIEHIWELPFYIWSIQRAARMEIPKSGTYMCEELGASISFDDLTKLSLPNGLDIMIAIDYGGNISQLYESDPLIRGSYTAYIDRGYIEVCFEKMPNAFEPGRTYVFRIQSEVQS